jgi:hypothetical protein
MRVHHHMRLVCNQPFLSDEILTQSPAPPCALMAGTGLLSDGADIAAIRMAVEAKG